MRTWRADTGEEQTSRALGGAVHVVRFAPARDSLGAVAEEGIARVWTDALPTDGDALRRFIKTATNARTTASGALGMDP